MPWYWTDDLAKALLASGKIDETVAARMMTVPVALRSDRRTLQEAAEELAEDDEIPLAA